MEMDVLMMQIILVYPQLVSTAAVTKPFDTTSPDAVITLTTTGGNPAQFQ
jgi:hypothetical protein